MDLMKLIHKKNPYEGFDKKLTLDLQGWFSNRPIFGELIRKTNPNLIIEVGSWKGASAINMGKHIKRYNFDCKILCVDTWLGSITMIDDKNDEDRYLSLKHKNGYPQIYFQFLSNVSHEKLAKTIIPFPQTSPIAARWLKLKDITADLIYIDASHDEPDVYSDISEYYELLNKDGIMFGDDYDTFPGVKRAVDRFAKENNLELTFDDDKHFWILKNKDNQTHLNKKIITM